MEAATKNEQRPTVDRRQVLVFPTQMAELFRSIFAPCCSLAIKLSCELNNVKIFATVLPRGVVMYRWCIKNHDF